VLSALGCFAGGASAHEGLPGLLELHEQGPGEYRIRWKQPIGSSGPAPVAPVFPPNCSVGGTGGVSIGAESRTFQGTLACADGLSGRTVSITALELTGAAVLVRMRHSDGRIENHIVRPASPALTLNSKGEASATSLSYLRLGLEHIMVGLDHLVFVWGLLLLISGWRRLLYVITAFTLAHSATLALAVLEVVNVALPPLNVVIALSILFLGVEVLRAAGGNSSLTRRRPALAAALFGSLHGVGFASGLSTAGLPRSEIPLALLAFNLGVEVGQLAFIALALLVAKSWRVLEITWSPQMTRLPGYVLGVSGAFWTLDRAIVMMIDP